jgi:tetratricopeptide (TPR) repeat protein
MRSPGHGICLAACLALASAVWPAPVTSLDRAAILLSQGRLDEALTELRLSTPALEDAQRSDLLEGLLLHRLKRDEEAVAPLERALARDAGDFDGRINLGQALQAGGRWDLARAEFEEARARFPDKPEPWLGLGQIAAGQGQAEEARRCFQRAADLAPGSPSAWLGLSDALLKQGLLRQAALAREKAIALGVEDPDLLFKQAVAWYGLGEYERSDSALRKAGLGDQPEAFFLAGCLQYKRGHLDSAEREFLAAMESKGGYPQAQLNLGIAYYDEERYDDALLQFDQLATGLDDPEAAAYRLEAAAMASDHYFRLGSQALLAGDLVGAIAPLQKAEALATDRDGPALRRLIERVQEQEGPEAESLGRQGEQALAGHDLARAVLLWQEALRLNPSLAAAKRGLEGVKGDLGALKQAYTKAALAADGSGDQASAEGLVERLGKLDETEGQSLEESLRQGRRERGEALLAAGVQEMDQGRPRIALGKFSRALTLDPSDRRALERRSQAQAALLAQVSGFLAQATEAEAQGQSLQAYKHMQEALAADPDDLEARQGLQRLARRLDLKRDGALQADDLYYQGVYAYGAGDTARALVLWHEGLRLSPGQGPLLEAVRSAELKQKALALLGRS